MLLYSQFPFWVWLCELKQKKNLLCQGRGLGQPRAHVPGGSPFDLTDNSVPSLWACVDPKDKENLHCMYPDSIPAYE